jgi:hypothetical protein
MLQRNQELIDQFNRDEQRWRRLQLRKVMRRVRFPKLGGSFHAILDLRDEMRERRRPADCISSKWIELMGPGMTNRDIRKLLDWI